MFALNYIKDCIKCKLLQMCRSQQRKMKPKKPLAAWCLECRLRDDRKLRPVLYRRNTSKERLCHIFCPLLIKQKSNSVILILLLICLQNAHIRLFKISFKTVIILQPARNLVIVRVGTVLPDGASQKGDCRHCWRSWSRDPHVITAFSVGPSAFPLSKLFHSLLHWIWQQPGTAQQGLNQSNFSSSEENQQKQIPNVSTVLANSNLYLLLWIPCYHVFLPILTNIWKQNNHRL